MPAVTVYMRTCLEYVCTYTYSTVAIYSVTCAIKVESCMLVYRFVGCMAQLRLWYWNSGNFHVVPSKNHTHTYHRVSQGMACTCVFLELRTI